VTNTRRGKGEKQLPRIMSDVHNLYDDYYYIGRNDNNNDYIVLLSMNNSSNGLFLRTLHAYQL